VFAVKKRLLSEALETPTAIFPYDADAGLGWIVLGDWFPSEDQGCLICIVPAGGQQIHSASGGGCCLEMKLIN